MAGLGDIKITDNEYRTCLVNGKEALFHRWARFAQPVGAEIAVGGAPGGQVEYTKAIVEFRDGKIELVNASSIQFTDNKAEEYYLSKHIPRID